jgi:hypothetical protein
VKVGSKATESPIDRRSINNPIRVGGRKSSILVVFLFCHLHQFLVRAVHAEDGVGRIMEGVRSAEAVVTVDLEARSSHES